MSGHPTGRHLLLFLIASAATLPVRAADPYLLLERLADGDKIPRLLSTVDFGLEAVDPEQLEPIVTDVNGDGKKDMVISGAYTLPGRSQPYFLLVAGDMDGVPTTLFSKGGPKPFYLHKAGSTGEGDPGDEAFAVTTCVHCSSGTDFVWDKSRRTLLERPWVDRVRHMVKVTTAAAAEVDPAVADKALQIAGRLKDVQDFVQKVNLRGTKLVTRVEPVADSTETARAKVLVFERVPEAEDELYDAITVDTNAGRVVRRQKIRMPRKASAAPDSGR